MKGKQTEMHVYRRCQILYIWKRQKNSK